MAWSLHDYGAMLLGSTATEVVSRGPIPHRPARSASADREGKPNRQKATALLNEALALSRELEMRPLMERVLAKREILGA